MINITKILIDDNTIRSVTKVLKSGFIVQGKIVGKLEKELAYCNNTKYAVVVNSGTAALHTALASAGITQGDEVITTAFSFVATVNAILMCGARPVFVDINETDYTINSSLIEKKITFKTKAILTADLYGQPCNYKEIKKIAKKHNLIVINDACQAIGSFYDLKPIGQVADIACFSFYATKNIVMGEGGALVTNNEDIYEYAKRFRQHGQDMEKPYVYHHIGYNYRSTDIAAAIGLSQLSYIKKWTKKRQENAESLTEGLKKIRGIITPTYKPDRTHVFHQYTIRVTNEFPISRDKLQADLLTQGIKSGIYYPSILPSHSHIKKIVKYKKGMFPIAELAANGVLSLPVHPHLTRGDIQKIIRTIAMVLK